MTLFIAIFISVIVILFIVVDFLYCPFKQINYSPRKIEFDITGRKAPQINDLLDEYLITVRNIDIFQSQKINAREYDKELKKWQEINKHKLNSMKWRFIIYDRRKNQFENVYARLSAAPRGVILITYRAKTRYHQINYKRYPYKVKEILSNNEIPFEVANNRFIKLSSINFSCTLSNYHSKDQRKLMTRELREQIMIRDNYTCAICGKYMPDEVGLQIDHIIPVNKGGKSIPSNLQVLCSKCNSKKSNKLTNIDENFN